MDPVAIGMTISASVLGSTLLTSLVTSLLNRRKNTAEADSIIGEAYGALIKTLRTEIDTLRNEFMFLKNQHETCHKENEILKMRIENLEQKK
jgi:outer membrane murein-binding lipoprotein Lpp